MPEDSPFGARLRHLRERRGLSREVFGGLVGRSMQWVKAVESGQLLMPRLPMLLRIADVLDITDLAELTGAGRLPVESITKGSHDHLATVADSMLTSKIQPIQTEPDLPTLRARVDLAWQRYVGLPDQKTAVADVLPSLLDDARATARILDRTDRRHALVELARVYSLAQCFLSWQPAAELVWMAADRAMLTAQDADDPAAIAAAAYLYGEVFLATGQYDRALSLALDTAALLDPATDDPELRARWGRLQLTAALAHAQAGHAGDSWRHWDLANQAADALGTHYNHPWLRFGRADVDGFALRIDVRLFHPGEAIRRGNQLDFSATPSPGRRASRLLDLAQAHQQRKEPVSVVHMIARAHRESPESVQYDQFARQALLELSQRRSTIRDDARQLAAQIGLAS